MQKIQFKAKFPLQPEGEKKTNFVSESKGQGITVNLYNICMCCRYCHKLCEMSGKGS